MPKASADKISLIIPVFNEAPAVVAAEAAAACCAPKAPVTRGKPLTIGVKSSGSGCC